MVDLSWPREADERPEEAAEEADDVRDRFAPDRQRRTEAQDPGHDGHVQRAVAAAVARPGPAALLAGAAALRRPRLAAGERPPREGLHGGCGRGEVYRHAEHDWHRVDAAHNQHPSIVCGVVANEVLLRGPTERQVAGRGNQQVHHKLDQHGEEGHLPDPHCPWLLEGNGNRHRVGMRVEGKQSYGKGLQSRLEVPCKPSHTPGNILSRRVLTRWCRVAASLQQEARCLCQHDQGHECDGAGAEDGDVAQCRDALGHGQREEEQEGGGDEGPAGDVAAAEDRRLGDAGQEVADEHEVDEHRRHAVERYDDVDEDGAVAGAACGAEGVPRAAQAHELGEGPALSVPCAAHQHDQGDVCQSGTARQQDDA
mmetsp:Transcript_63563/g.153752  ORF Transcript_63563/g.153752 Transcript_63563/m.153752 type:complete len:368 (-) Transcript_63563:7-1110(-)